VILELTNPDLEQQVNDAMLAYRTAQAGFENRKTELERALLNQQTEVAGIEAQYNEAFAAPAGRTRRSSRRALCRIQLKQGAVARGRPEEPPGDGRADPGDAERRMQSQLAPRRQKSSSAVRWCSSGRTSWRISKSRPACTACCRSSRSRSGRRSGPGTNLARVADPANLKAELRIPETQTRDLRIGQLAEVDTRNGVVKGRVARIDPAAVGGTVGVDVILEDDLPAGARPDQSVDGTVLLEQLIDVVYVSRPAIGQENGTIMLFKLTGDGHAVQTRVELGRSAVSQIEVRSGLQPGDQVILSDMSAHDSFERIRIVN
jgi:HlyD family secretion protein